MKKTLGSMGKDICTALAEMSKMSIEFARLGRDVALEYADAYDTLLRLSVWLSITDLSDKQTHDLLRDYTTPQRDRISELINEKEVQNG